MAAVRTSAVDPNLSPEWTEKELDTDADPLTVKNPVLSSAEFALKHTNLVKVEPSGVRAAAKHIYNALHETNYSPATWRAQPLHLLPPAHYSPEDPRTKACLDWIFLVSALNFSFWSEKESPPVSGLGSEERFGVEWRAGWGQSERAIFTGYWSLVAAINKALESGIPITDPVFYASSTSCPDIIIENMFQPAPRSTESVPMLRERIAVMREVGSILTTKFGGSYMGLLAHFMAKYSGNGTALQLVQMITDEFPPFRDEFYLNGEKLCFWKRAQILVAETWAAFYPPEGSTEQHPFFPHGIGQLTMFADYRVPQILHHLGIISYPSHLEALLQSHTYIESGSREELSIRAGSILAVEAVREEMTRLDSEGAEEVPSVLIDFFLWDLAKRVEQGVERIDGIETAEILPAHRTRSICY